MASKSPAKKNNALADALLDAHVGFLARELVGPGLQAAIEEELDEALINLRKLHLGDVATGASVSASLHAVVMNNTLDGKVRELVAELAVALHAQLQRSSTGPADLLSEDDFLELVDLFLGLAPLREKLVQEVVSSPLYAAFTADLLYGGIKGYVEAYLAQNAVTRKVPGAQSMLKLGRAMLSKASPELEATLEEGLKKYIARAVQASSAASVEFLLTEEAQSLFRQGALDAWRRVGAGDFGDLAGAIESTEVTALAEAVHDVWLKLRGTDFARRLLDTGVEAFFEVHGSRPLSELLDHFGLSRELLLTEALRHAPRWVAALKKKKMLEPLLRRRLRGFYHSAAIEAVLAAHTVKRV